MMDKDLNGFLMVERVTRLETEVKQVLENQAALKGTIEDVHVKLDDLLALKNKGMGALWFASALVGTGVVSFFWLFVDWIKGGIHFGS